MDTPFLPTPDSSDAAAIDQVVAPRRAPETTSGSSDPQRVRSPGLRAGAPARSGSSWRERVDQMDEAEVRDLITTLPAIEQAKGMLMAYYGLDAEHAFAVLRRWSTVHHIKIRDLAALLVEHCGVDVPTRADATGPAGGWRPFDPVRAFLAHPRPHRPADEVQSTDGRYPREPRPVSEGRSGGALFGQPDLDAVQP